MLFVDLLLGYTTLANHVCAQAADVFITSPSAMNHSLYL